MEDDLIKLSLIDVQPAVPAGNGVEAGLVVLEEDEAPRRQLFMYVGQPEARAIHTAWSNEVPPRPSTWDLFVSTVSLLDGRIDRAIISDVHEERHFFAQLVLEREASGAPLIITARPSDAIALALRAYGADIYARPEVLDAAGVPTGRPDWVRTDDRALAGSIDTASRDTSAGWAGTDGEWKTESGSDEAEAEKAVWETEGGAVGAAGDRERGPSAPEEGDGAEVASGEDGGVVREDERGAGEDERGAGEDGGVVREDTSLPARADRRDAKPRKVRKKYLAGS